MLPSVFFSLFSYMWFYFYCEINLWISDLAMLTPSTNPISRTPYRMVLMDLRELKEQLQELLDKELICWSISPWGALELFGKKKETV